VAGTPGSLIAQHHFIDFFEKNLPEWKVEIHNSTSTTPATGDEQIPFANLIFRRDPPWSQVGDVGRLTLVAHYDTLFRPHGFIGAIDSAASCAMLLHAARTIENALVKKWSRMMANGEAGSGLEEEKGIQIILLDGEEAFVSWTETDSLYGSRYVPTRSISLGLPLLQQKLTDTLQSPCKGLGRGRVSRPVHVQVADQRHQPLPASRPPGISRPQDPFLLHDHTLGVPSHGQN
jgi:hypothetical protein